MVYSSRLKLLGLAFLSIVFSFGCGLPSESEEIAPEISVDLSNATALFIVDESSGSTESLNHKSATSDEEALGYLRKILSDGTIETVMVELDDGVYVPATVRPTSVFVGPDDKIYITFKDFGVRINDENCFLLRASLEGSVECYGEDDGIIGDYPPTSEVFSYLTNLDRISSHFDADGNFYFYDSPSNSVGFTKYFKKLSPEGTISEVAQFTESSIESYAVGLDGTLFFQGSDDVSRFFRRTTADGGVENLEIDAGGDYIVASNGDLFVSGIYHGVMEGSDIVFEEIEIPAEESALKALIDSASDDQSFLEDSSGNIYGIAHRIFPGDPVRVIDSNHDVTLARTSGNYLYYSGLDESNTNIFRRVDITDETFPSTDLLNGEDIEVYRFQVWSDGSILFGGLRLSDNQLILGEIDGETLELTVTTTTSTRIDELVLIE